MCAIAKRPEPCDLIFVFAGREDRKRYGLSLFREGFAPRLVLSVGRFEWRRFAELGLEDDGGLVPLVGTVEPERRHFFVEIGTATPARAEWVKTGRLGTLSEARALAGRIEELHAKKTLVVTSSVHLRRAMLSLRIYLPRGVEVVPVASPDPEGRDSPAVELAKLLGYGLLAPFLWACARGRFLL